MVAAWPAAPIPPGARSGPSHDEQPENFGSALDIRIILTTLYKDQIYKASSN